MKQQLSDLLESALNSLLARLDKTIDVPTAITIEATRDNNHGDFASNLALTVAKRVGMPPRQLAQELIAELPTTNWLVRAEIAGPGFINFFLAPLAFQSVVSRIINEGMEYGDQRSPGKGKILVEYVSANPTGPMHVGHGRGAAYGDSLANILEATGWDVHREYYVNDAGRQVDILTISVWVRYLQSCGESVKFPNRGYPADYVSSSSRKLKSLHGEKLVHSVDAVSAGLPPDPESPESGSDSEKAEAKSAQETHLDSLIIRAKSLLGDTAYCEIRDLALDDQIAAIRKTLGDFGVEFDQWFSERSLVSDGKAAEAIKRLTAAGHVYEKDGAQWLKTSDFGDEKDRVLFKADGNATYFANDLAYHIDKLDRGNDTLLDIWGADHHGYVGRVRAAIEALTGRKEALRVQLMQFVTLSSGRMGKRSGNFVTLQDLIDEAGRDATRFFYLLRSHDQHLEFDIELATSRSNENPVYYVQYAHARICSVLRQVEDRNESFDPAASDTCLHRLETRQEMALIKQLCRFPELLEASGRQSAPHMVAFYLKDLAEAFHSTYNAHKFVVDDRELRQARLALISATKIVLARGLSLLGVSAPESM